MNNLKQDYKAYGMNAKKLILSVFVMSTFWLVVMYRLSHWLLAKGVPIIPYTLKALCTVIYSADISPKAKIGPGFRVIHSVGVVVGPGVEAGKNLELFQNTTLGGRDRANEGRTEPLIGDNVTIFSGSVVIGPVVIGENVSVGANSVVTKDIPNNCSVVGAPARVVGDVDIPHSLRSMKRK